VIATCTPALAGERDARQGGAMAEPQSLLNADGSASVATLLLMAHHGFRRDIIQLGRALAQLRHAGDARHAALQREWQWYSQSLHGHHQMEDTQIFPSIASKAPALERAIDQLSAEHREIDPLLAQGDVAFTTLSDKREAAARVVAELAKLLEAHFAFEEAELAQVLREERDFPSPADDAQAQTFAQGFAWSSHGVATDVLERLYAELPPLLRSKIPAARAEYAKRCEAAWGTAAGGDSRTCIPDWL
jgi:hemerythrin-like domain-containing protein